MELLTRDALADRLSANREVFRHLLSGVVRQQARWRPAPDRWCILEVVCHLADEEREDFRPRLARTLGGAGGPWPPIDPERWVFDRQYRSRELPAALEDFIEERSRSVEWIRGLAALPLTSIGQHPELGPMTSGDLVASWLAHDLLHLRQIAGLYHAYLSEAARPHSVAYAGGW